jgi:hypothetical protein
MEKLMNVTWKEEGKVLRFEAETEAEMSLIGYLFLPVAYPRESKPYAGMLSGAPIIRRECAAEWANSSAVEHGDYVIFHGRDAPRLQVLCGFELDLARLSFNGGPLPSRDQTLQADGCQQLGRALLDGLHIINAQFANDRPGLTAGVAPVEADAQV